MQPSRAALVLTLLPLVSAQVQAQRLPRAPRGNGLWIAAWGTNNVVRCDLLTGDCQVVVPSGSGGLARTHTVSFGLDGNLYVASWSTSSVLRYNGDDFSFIDEFVAAGDGGLQNTHTVTWGPDGNLYVAGEFTDGVNRYDGVSGAFIDAFIPKGAGLNGPEFIDYGPDGLLYVCDNVNNRVARYDPITGIKVDNWIPKGDHGLNRPHFFTWGPDHNFYISSSNTDEVFRYDGTTGAFIDKFIPAGLGNLGFPAGLAFTQDGRELLVASFSNSRILRYEARTGAFLGIAFSGNQEGFTGPLWIGIEPRTDLRLMAPVPGKAGVSNELVAWRAPARRPLRFVGGLGHGWTSVPMCPGLDHNVAPPFSQLGTIITDSTGSATLTYVPDPALVGTTVFLQAIDPRGCRTSQLVRFTYQ